jgi:hypothetical protein
VLSTLSAYAAQVNWLRVAEGVGIVLGALLSAVF